MFLYRLTTINKTPPLPRISCFRGYSLRDSNSLYFLKEKQQTW